MPFCDYNMENHQIVFTRLRPGRVTDDMLYTVYTILQTFDISGYIQLNIEHNMEGRKLKLVPTLNSEKILNMSPLQASYGASFLSYLEKRYSEIFSAVRLALTVFP